MLCSVSWDTRVDCSCPSEPKTLLFKSKLVDIYLSWWNPVRESYPTMATRSACLTFWLRCQQDTSDKMIHPRSSAWAAMRQETITSSGPSFLLWRWVILDAVLVSYRGPGPHLPVNITGTSYCLTLHVFVNAERWSIPHPQRSGGDADEPFTGVWGWAFTSGEPSGVLWWN